MARHMPLLKMYATWRDADGKTTFLEQDPEQQDMQGATVPLADYQVSSERQQVQWVDHPCLPQRG